MLRVTRDAINEVSSALRRHYPNMSRNDASYITEIVIDSWEHQPHPKREWAEAVIAAAQAYIEAWRRDGDEQAGVARRYLEEALYAGDEDPLAVREWTLHDSRGEAIGSFKGTRTEFDRLQRATP